MTSKNMVITSIYIIGSLIIKTEGSQISCSKVSKYQNIVFNLSSLLDVKMIRIDYIPWKFWITAFTQIYIVYTYIGSHHHWTRFSV